jgi:hypothetical protein
VVAALLSFFVLFFTSPGHELIAPTVVRLRLAAPGVFGHGEYKFSQTVNGEPVTFSSCRTLRIVINDKLRPAAAYGLVEEAVAEVSKASGLTMTVIGPTDEVSNPNRASQQGRYGLGWAPILIGWTTPEVIPQLAGNPIGRGGPRGVTETATRQSYYVTGQVYLDTPALERLLRRGHKDQVRAVIMHELGHVLGLAHVGSPYELMSSHNYGLTRFGPGDLAGLARLGKGPCV